MMEFNLHNGIGHLAFILTALSFYVKDMLLLRALALASGLIMISYNYLMPQGTLWLGIFWLSVFLLINSYRSIGLILERRHIDMTAEEAELHETIFSHFTAVEFMKLMRIGTWCRVSSGALICRQGEILSELRLLYNGEVLIERDGDEIGRAKDGAMIGEISFLQNGPATANVTATANCRLVAWSGDELRSLLARNPNLSVSMQQIFSADLMKKLSGN